MHVALTRRHGRGVGAFGAGRFGSERCWDLRALSAGGATTLRGFDEQAFRVDRYLLSRLEWRWFAGTASQHLATFWDHAWTFTRLPVETGTRTETVNHDAVGLGLRVVSPAGWSV
jgi:hemolysin activation/secretion protein